MIGDGRNDCTHGIDETSDAAAIKREVRHNLWHHLMYLGDWRCPDPGVALKDCDAPYYPRPRAYLHSFPYMSYTGCELGLSFKYWHCREANSCVRPGHACERRTMLRQGVRCPASYSVERGGTECVKRICPVNHWTCNSK